METIRLTVAQAIVRFLIAQRTEVDGQEAPLFPGVFAIFGHGNVTALGDALFAARDRLPTWRGQNEQTMAMAAVAFAKARRRRQIMVATSSIGPGATNMVTAAAIAHADRLPLLILSGDTFASRIPDPVLQQVEHFDDPTTTVNDAFRAVTRSFDRITHPAQILGSLPQAVATLLDPADCGPAFIGLPQDVQALAFDYPAAFFENRLHRVRRPGPDPDEIEQAAAAIRGAQRPFLIAGGGVHYSLAEDVLAGFADRRGIPVAETMAGRACLPWNHPRAVGPIGVTGGTAANALAANADVVVAVGTRLQDFTTGSWSVFRDPDVRLVSINAARHDATKHLAVRVVADARRALEELDASLDDWRAGDRWVDRAAAEYATWNAYLDEVAAREDGDLPSYAQVVRAVNRAAGDDGYVVAAAGGLPGELNKHWRAPGIGGFDCEYGYSCMGYEVGGAWGAAMALPGRTVFSLCGDGSYLMANSDVYGSILSGHPFVLVLCDNGGYAVIRRLQVGTGGAPFNNMIGDGRVTDAARVDFVRHAESLGAHAERVERIDELEAALGRAAGAGRTSVVVIETDPDRWTGGDAWWDVGIPEVSERDDVLAARAEHEAERTHQRPGV